MNEQVSLNARNVKLWILGKYFQHDKLIKNYEEIIDLSDIYVSLFIDKRLIINSLKINIGKNIPEKYSSSLNRGIRIRTKDGASIRTYGW